MATEKTSETPASPDGQGATRPIGSRPRQAQDRAAVSSSAQRADGEYSLGSDALRRCETLFGTRRTRELAERAGALQPMLRGWSDAELHVERQRWGDPLATVDRRGARETLTAERNEYLAKRDLRKARKDRAALNRLAAQGQEQRDLQERLAAIDKSAQWAQKRLDAAGKAQGQLREEGRHLDSWMLGDHGAVEGHGPVKSREALARVLALEGAHIARERARDREAVLQRFRDGDVRDPLVEYGPLLGDGRTRWIARRARIYAETLPDRDQGWLSARLDELNGALAPVDREAAKEVLGLEAQRSELKDGLTKTEVAIRDLAQLEGTVADEATQEEIRAALAAETADAKGARTRLAELSTKENGLRKAGRHPDEWMKKHGQDAAESVALRRELTIRREMEKVRTAREAGQGHAPGPETGAPGPAHEVAASAPPPEAAIEM